MQRRRRRLEHVVPPHTGGWKNPVGVCGLKPVHLWRGPPCTPAPGGQSPRSLPCRCPARRQSGAPAARPPPPGCCPPASAPLCARARSRGARISVRSSNDRSRRTPPLWRSRQVELDVQRGPRQHLDGAVHAAQHQRVAARREAQALDLPARPALPAPGAELLGKVPCAAAPNLVLQAGAVVVNGPFCCGHAPPWPAELHLWRARACATCPAPQCPGAAPRPAPWPAPACGRPAAAPSSSGSPSRSWSRRPGPSASFQARVAPPPPCVHTTGVHRSW